MTELADKVVDNTIKWTTLFMITKNQVVAWEINGLEAD